jgi:hypothetical protein
MNRLSSTCFLILTALGLVSAKGGELVAEKGPFKILRPEHAPVTTPNVASDKENSLPLDVLILSDGTGSEQPIVLSQGRIEAKFDETGKFLVILDREDRANFEILILDLATRKTLAFESSETFPVLLNAMAKIHVDAALGPFEPEPESLVMKADHVDIVAVTGNGEHQAKMRITLPLPPSIRKDGKVGKPGTEILSMR